MDYLLKFTLKLCNERRSYVTNFSEILMIVPKNESISHSGFLSFIKDRSPINEEDEKSISHYIYFELEERVECISVSKVIFLHGFDEKRIVYYLDKGNSDGVIGFIYEEDEVTQFIKLDRFIRENGLYIKKEEFANETKIKG